MEIINKPNSLLSRFMKSIYFNSREFLSTPVGARPSFTWQSLLYGRELLQQGIHHRVGNGKSTKVCLDKWTDDPEEGLCAPLIKNYLFDVNLKEEDLINADTRRCDVLKLPEVFVLGDVEIILKSQSVVSKEDYVSWKYNKSGRISVKSAYWLQTWRGKRTNPNHIPYHLKRFERESLENSYFTKTGSLKP